MIKFMIGRFRTAHVARAAFLIGVVFLHIGYAEAPDPPSEGSIDELRRGPITVLHAPADEALAREVSRRAEHLHNRISTDLGLENKVKAHILLATPRLPEGTFRDMERKLPSWFAGAAYAGRQFILLRIRPGQTSLDHDSLLAHELTHVILKGDYPNQAGWPLWFREGLAMRESRGEGLRYYTSLSLASLRRRLIPLDELKIGFPDNEAASRLAYAESFSVIAFLIGRFGHRRFQDFMDTLRGQEFEEAFRQTYGSGLGSMEKQWRRHVQRRFTWIPLLTGGTAVWTFILVLFFLTLAVRRRKDRLLREQWEEEERDLLH